MSYAFHPDDADLTHALRRIAGAELDRAIATLGQGMPGASGIHDIRKRIKKLRGLFRLLRAGFPEGAQEIDILRDLAGGLAGVRDAEVMLAAHDGVAGYGGAGLRQVLQGRIEAARGAEAPDPAALRDALADMRARSEIWRVRGGNGKVLRKGLARTLSRGGDALDHARDSRDPEAFHDWRKRVKDLWYQLRLLTPVWPAGIGPWCQVADDLGEALGTHHDLVLYVDWLETQDDGEAPALRAAAGIRRAAIEAQALATGARLYDADAEDVARLFTALWQGWRHRGEATPLV